MREGCTCAIRPTLTSIWPNPVVVHGFRAGGSGCAGARRPAAAIDLVQDATGSGRVAVAAQRCIGRQLVALSPLERSCEEIRLRRGARGHPAEPPAALGCGAMSRALEVIYLLCGPRGNDGEQMMETDGLLAILVVVALRRVADRPLVRLTPANQLFCLPFSRFCALPSGSPRRGRCRSLHIKAHPPAPSLRWRGHRRRKKSTM